MEFIIGYALSLLVGITLGLVGSGGSILTVPILVYAFGVSAETATAYSLFIVGLTALVGAGGYYRKSLVDLRTVLVFSVPSLIAVYLVRKFVMPAIPDPVFSVGGSEVSKGMLIMGVFAVLMIAASFSMIRKRKTDCDSPEITEPTFNYPLIFIEGVVVGGLTGFVGAGGGFLIIPALVLLARLPMKVAIGTSLLIIAIKSLVGFTGDLSADTTIDWPFLLLVSLFTIIGMFGGMALGKHIPGEKLRPTFGWFVLLMGLWIFTKEVILK